MRGLNDFFETSVNIKRVRHGEKQTIETLINEEAQLFARYLRNELKTGIPRVHERL
jgi:hypothetical protein